MSNSEMSLKLEEIPVSEILPLLFKVSHFLQQEFEYELSLYDLPKQLTGSRIRVLLEISEAGSLRMNELASRLGIKARTVTQFIDVLEAENYIKRLRKYLFKRLGSYESLHFYAVGEYGPVHLLFPMVQRY